MKSSKKKTAVLLIASEIEENLSIRYLGGILDHRGYHVEIAPCSDRKDIPKVVKKVRKSKPHLIGISMAFQSLANMFFKLVSEIRKAGFDGLIATGGHFPTFEYKKILETQEGIDCVVRYEGEQPIVELAEYCDGERELSSVTNLVYRDADEIQENVCRYKFQILDELPFPLRSKKPQERLGERFSTLVASRGCWHSKCAYCCIGAFHYPKRGEKFALRSPCNIASEIAYLYHNRGVRLFQFHDDNFLLPTRDANLERFRTIKSALLEDNVNPDTIALLIKARPDNVNDEDVVVLLKELGVVGVFLGVENASETGLKALRRGTSLPAIINAMDLLRQHDIAITYNLLIFHPEATLDEINQNIHFVSKNLEFPFDFGRTEIVAGSPLEKQVIEENLLQGKWPNWDYKIKDMAVEQMFRINTATFRKKESNFATLAHGNISFSYHASVVTRLYPGAVSQKLRSDTTALIIKSNRFIIDNLLELYRLVATLKSEDEINALFTTINDGSKDLTRESRNLSFKMLYLQTIEKSFRKIGFTQRAQNSKAVKWVFGL